MGRWSNKWCTEAKTEESEPNSEREKSLELSGADDHTTCRFVPSEEEELYSVTKSSDREKLKQSAKIYNCK
jgi:hypothetical protein